MSLSRSSRGRTAHSFDSARDAAHEITPISRPRARVDEAIALSVDVERAPRASPRAVDAVAIAGIVVVIVLEIVLHRHARVENGSKIFSRITRAIVVKSVRRRFRSARAFECRVEGRRALDVKITHPRSMTY